jgi:1-deoxy-D-xylulose-5-phosphate synthase
VAVRYPRGAGVAWRAGRRPSGAAFGKGEVRRNGRGVAILAFGTLLYPALEVAAQINATVVNMRWAKPLDTALLLKVAAAHEALVTVEDGAVMGGAGSAVGEALAAAGIAKPVLHLGLPR